MPSLPPPLQNRLRDALLKCAPFGSNDALRAVFSDARISAWQHNVPEAVSSASRVSFLVSQFMDAWNAGGENALSLFLCALSDFPDRGAQCSTEDLCALSAEMHKTLIAGKIAECERELAQVKDHQACGWGDPVYAQRRAAELQAMVQTWQKRQDSPPSCQAEPLKVAAVLASTGSALPSAVQLSESTPETYTDIQIHILGKANDAYPVTAKLSDGASFSGEFRPDQGALLAIEKDAEAYSECLSHALFVGDMEKAYFKAQTLAEVTTQRRLRLRLWIDNTAAELQTLRWEHLCYWRDTVPLRLAATADRPFSRYFGLGLADPELLATPPIRMLAVIANPRNLPDFGLPPLTPEAEISTLLEALKDVPNTNVAMTLLPGQSIVSDALRQRLDAAGITLETGSASLDRLLELLGHQSGYHILHFLGHGGYNQRHKQFGLFFEDDMGNVEQVRERELAAGLQETGRLPHLIFLAACESAKRLPEVANPFVGISPRLIQAGVPAVAAMQDTIGGLSASKLTRVFYRSLFADGLVDKAMNQARSALARDDAWESAIPVLFTRLRSGRLFGHSIRH